MRHGVYITYGVTKVKMSAKKLQLIADALETINTDSDRVEKLARNLSATFLALSEYAASVK